MRQCIEGSAPITQRFILPRIGVLFTATTVPRDRMASSQIGRPWGGAAKPCGALQLGG